MLTWPIGRRFQLWLSRQWSVSPFMSRVISLVGNQWKRIDAVIETIALCVVLLLLSPLALIDYLNS